MSNKDKRNDQTTTKDRSFKNRSSFGGGRKGKNKNKDSNIQNELDGLEKQKAHKKKIAEKKINTPQHTLNKIDKKIEDFKVFQHNINYEEYELQELKELRDKSKKDLDEITQLLNKFNKSKSDVRKSAMIDKMSDLQEKHKELLEIFYQNDKNYNFKKTEVLESTLIKLNQEELNKLSTIIEIVKTTDKKVTKNQYNTQEIKSKIKILENDLSNLSQNQDDNFAKLFRQISDIFQKCTQDIESINKVLISIPAEIVKINRKCDELNKLSTIIDIVKTTDTKVTKNQYDTQEIKSKLKILEPEIVKINESCDKTKITLDNISIKTIEINKELTLVGSMLKDISNDTVDIHKIVAVVNLILTSIEANNNALQKTINEERQIIKNTMNDLKLPQDILEKLNNTTSKKDIDLLLINALNSGDISKFDYDRINSHTTNSKNEIMFDIVDIIIELIGKKRFWKFLSYAPVLNSFVFTYEKYLKIILNTLIVIIIGGLVGGYLSSKYFSDDSKNMQNKINANVSKTIKFVDKKEYDRLCTLNVEFEPLSTEVTSAKVVDKNSTCETSELSQMIKEICTKNTIDNVFIAGFASGEKIEKNKNINYDDNFDLSFARANSIKYMIYNHCQNIESVNIVNLVKEKSTDKTDQKAEVKFYTKKRGK